MVPRRPLGKPITPQTLPANIYRIFLISCNNPWASLGPWWVPYWHFVELLPIWPCLFCMRQTDYAHPAHHRNFRVGDLPTAGWEGWHGTTGKRERLKWAWEAISGICTCPYLSSSVRIEFGTWHTPQMCRILYGEFRKCRNSDGN